jgi:hypothetical protein
VKVLQQTAGLVVLAAEESRRSWGTTIQTVADGEQIEPDHISVNRNKNKRGSYLMFFVLHSFNVFSVFIASSVRVLFYDCKFRVVK